jgi:exodeoxyribonuclease-5
MGLTSHQSERLEEGLDILTKSSRLLITGSAGVGKTFMVNELVKQLATRIPGSKKIICSAPTNKAVAVVKGKVDQIPNLEFATVHSSLKIKKTVDNRTGAESYTPYYSEKYPPLKDVGLFIVDETSMLSTELLNYLEIHATRNRAIVVFIGDRKQLNPVGEEMSPVFLGKPNVFEEESKADEFIEKLEAADKYGNTKKEIDNKFFVYVPYPEVELTEIIRQGEGNPIIDLSRNLTDIALREDNRVDSNGYIFSSDEAQVVETLATVNGTDELKYLAYNNKEVDRINNLVRKRIYGTPAKVEVGETLIFNQPYGDYYTNQEIKVDELEIRTKKFFYPSGKAPGVFETVTTFKPIEFKYYSINPTFALDSKEKIDTVVVIHEESQADYDKLLKSLAAMCVARKINWTDMYTFKEGFGDMTYNHAITIHKSQGSTYKQTIVNVKSIGFNKNTIERDRLLYTAITRASDLLILYKM